MKDRVKITGAEWPIMEKLWACSTATAAEIVDHVANTRAISMRTVKTLLRRLLAKGAAAYEIDSRDSRKYHYRALFSRDEAIELKNGEFLKQVYGKNVSGMLTHFIKNSDLSPEEIKSLQEVLAQKEVENA